MEKTLYVFDLDGVLFDNHQRQDLLPTGDGQTTEQWDAFNLACENDEPIAHMFALLIELFKSGNSIVFLTGRSDVCRTQTINAMQAVLQGHMSRSAIQLALNMRRQSDHRSGAEFKRSFLLRLKYDGRVVLIDDDPTIIEACRDVVSAVIHVKPHRGCAAVQKHRTVSMPAAMAAPYGNANSDIYQSVCTVGPEIIRLDQSWSTPAKEETIDQLKARIAELQASHNRLAKFIEAVAETCEELGNDRQANLRGGILGIVSGIRKNLPKVKGGAA